jgi:aromatic ring-opening dioxygenase catalytic subunit (LigB family)
MAELVGVFAASHTPVMINFPDAVATEDRVAIFSAFESLGRQLRAADPDTIIVISDDHLHNFFLNNFPAFCIGAADAYATPAEHWLKIEKQVLRGDASLGAHLIGEAMRSGFDPSFSMELTLDHGVLAPLHLAGSTLQACVVPVIVNCVQPPLPSMQRALDWGRFLRKAVATYPASCRVAILATGGISHDVGTPRMGAVNEQFDREFIRLLAGNDLAALVTHCEDNVNTAGNGAEEIRTWLMAHGAAGETGFEELYYKAMPGWYTGIGLAKWYLGH